MKYFIDTEFIEGDVSLNFGGFNIPKWLIKPNNTVQLISVALVSSDNREYYAISKDFNLKEAWNRWQQRTGEGDRNNIEPRLYWLRDNVLKPIYKELHRKENINARQALYRANIYIPETEFKFTYKNLKYLINKYGKTNKQIAEEIRQFCLPTHGFVRDWYESKNGIIDTSRDFKYLKQYEENFEKEYEDYQHPKFYGYYCDYDWVVFCWLFGKMIDLPKGFPKYCIDLKQELDRRFPNGKYGTTVVIPKLVNGTLLAELSPKTEYKEINIKEHPNYPKQNNEHNALSDAKWNFELFKFLQDVY